MWVPQVAAGLGHCMAASKGGDLYSWGWNAGNQLGLGPTEGSQVVALPTKLDFGLGCRLLAAGRAHSLLWASEPCLAVHACGSGWDGRLGLGSQQGSACLEVIPDLEGISVLGLACGMDHSIVLVEA